MAGRHGRPEGSCRAAICKTKRILVYNRDFAMPAPAPNGTSFIGRDPERLSIAERTSLTGRWMAMEIYTPQNLPLRRIEALGNSVDECAIQLRDRGLDPMMFEYSVVTPPY